MAEDAKDDQRTLTQFRPEPIVVDSSKTKVKGTSMLTSAARFVLRRIKGTKTWQRLQVRRNTLDNV
eukprot:CAMPEP_0172193766 /NCGR_PEP_ID=MMETSP1050-20130122/25161_1 /TAXON_ID=233186 /ORGANISM="Cryptomonas curvata, Strain CCAP979/52" /LENGTH=65 /DNA_ID=CAMNT_0012869407 /DNA_START=318 /DNA_END=511 /DNA_ORIENTATION=-